MVIIHVLKLLVCFLQKYNHHQVLFSKQFQRCGIKDEAAGVNVVKMAIALGVVQEDVADLEEAEEVVMDKLVEKVIMFVFLLLQVCFFFPIS